MIKAMFERGVLGYALLVWNRMKTSYNFDSDISSKNGHGLNGVSYVCKRRVRLRFACLELHDNKLSV